MELSEQVSCSRFDPSFVSLFSYKVKLANLPTPLEFCSGFSKKIGRRIFIKRDDLTGAALSGNKARKLEYILAYALSCGATAIMTCGATSSNHARISALAARCVGLKPYLLLKKYNKPEKDFENANIYLMRLANAEIIYCDEKEYENRDSIMQDWANSIDEKVYIIPEGGSTEIGVLGYIEAYKEIIEDCKRLSLEPDGIVVAVGSGGTYAGLLLGSAIFDFEIPIYGYSVWRNPSYYVDEIKKIIERFEKQFSFGLNIDPARIRVFDGSFGYPYGETSRDEQNLIQEFAANYGIILDPVYTSRAINGFLNFMPHGKSFIFVHTGGIFGLLKGGEFFKKGEK